MHSVKWDCQGVIKLTFYNDSVDSLIFITDKYVFQFKQNLLIYIL